MLIAISGVLLDLGLPLASLTSGENDLPLPTFQGLAMNTDEENYYMHLLAQISLNRLIVRISSFQATFKIQQPSTSLEQEPSKQDSPSPKAKDTDPHLLSIWISEVNRQLDEWRAHLPDPLKWNDGHTAEMPNAGEDPSPLAPLFVPSGAFDMPLEQIHDMGILIAVLRSKYLHAKYLIGLPVIHKALHFPDRLTQKDVDDCAVFLKVRRFPYSYGSCEIWSS